MSTSSQVHHQIYPTFLNYADNPMIKIIIIEKRENTYGH